MIKPGVSFSTINAEIPLFPASGFVEANTMYVLASPPFVINTFDPLII